jgi:epoxyqueuosine reductase
MKNVAENIKEKGRELGFAEIAICDAEPLEDAGELLLSWLGNRFHGTMEWMARTRYKRANPKSYFPDAKSIIVVAYNYFRENEAVLRPPNEGNISIYARGRDYHKVLRGKLKTLLQHIQTLLPEARGRVCVDSFPIMEKALAVKSGIGWIGKHSNLIIKKKGSYFFLGEILLSEKLPIDQPFTADYCGDCNRCQVACPTKALEQAFVLDARRCISYLTIEHGGEIDPELQAGMENWVFGCDICQAVCPWNRFSTHTEERQFDSRLSDEQFDLTALQALSEAEFLAMFEGTPVRRAGYKNFMRNVNIAKGNSG